MIKHDIHPCGDGSKMFKTYILTISAMSPTCALHPVIACLLSAPNCSAAPLADRIFYVPISFMVLPSYRVGLQH